MKYFKFPLFIFLFFFLSGTFVNEKLNSTISSFQYLNYRSLHIGVVDLKRLLKSKQTERSEVRYQKYVAFLCGIIFYVSKKLLFPFHSLIQVLIATSFMQSLLLSVKRLRRVLIIFFKPAISCFFGRQGLGGRSRQKKCAPFLYKKKVCVDYLLQSIKINFKLIYIKTTKCQVLLKQCLASICVVLAYYRNS